MKVPAVFTSVNEKKIVHEINKADVYKEAEFERLVASYKDLSAREHRNFEEEAKERSSKIRHEESSHATTTSKVFDSQNAAKLLEEAAKAADEREKRFHATESAYHKKQEERHKEHEMQLQMHMNKEKNLLHHLLNSEQQIESSAIPEAKDAMKLLEQAKDGEAMRQGQYHNLVNKYKEASKSDSMAFDEFLKEQAKNQSNALALSSNKIKAGLEMIRNIIYSSKEASEEEASATHASEQKEHDFEERVKKLAARDQEDEEDLKKFRSVKDMLRSRIDQALSKLEAPARNGHLGSLSEKRSEEEAHELEIHRQVKFLNKVQDEKQKLAESRLRKKADLRQARINEAIKEREREEEEEARDKNIKETRSLLHRRRRVDLQVKNDQWPSEAF
eukprot:760078-Hanusia_phi.AAC.1